MRIGIDVGGTNTDAVLMDGLTVLGAIKTPTTPDVTGGIVTAVGELLGASEVSASDILAVMIGTTHFTNAVVERRRLLPVGAIRMGMPATEALPPMIDWPAGLRARMGEHVYLCRGGYEYDGREISRLDPGELRRIGEELAAAGIETVAISSVFSPVNAAFELEASRILHEDHPGLLISCSHQVGRIGLLERENATILNASLRPLAAQMTASFEDALRQAGVQAPVYLSQNDGTLMHSDFAEQYPVMTFASGPTNSMRGAAFLSGHQNCAVVDVGGTTSDIGVLRDGFPREAHVTVSIGDVPTNLRMPDVLPIGIGGGSYVRTDGALTVGPDSVGHELPQRALVFGGSVLTATDLAVAAGRIELGDPALAARIDRDVVERGLALIAEGIAETVDKMKTSAAPIPVVVVGGGSILLDEELSGASELVRPEHSAVANAIGAAIAEVGGEVERVYSLERLSREEALRDATDEASEKAIAAGARRDSIRVVDVEEVGLAYVPGNAVRIKVRAVGDLELEREPVAGDH